MTPRVDLNCDLGESFGPWQLGNEERIFPLISSANIACGYHAGDPATMRRTVQLAKRHGVAVGAHPGLPDLEGFGRRDMGISADEAYELTLYQLGALDAFTRAEGVRLAHVKPHGALYNMAARDAALAEALASAVKAFRDDLVLFGQPSSEHERTAVKLGVRFAAEVFADRGYRADGTLVPRRDHGAFITDPVEAAARVVAMVRERRVKAVSGEWVELRADTVCLHGDSPQALEWARTIRRALAEAGIEVTPPWV